MRVRISIATKFFLTYFVITGAALAFAGAAGYLQFRRYAIDEMDQGLLRQARFAAAVFRPFLEAKRPDGQAIAGAVDRLGAAAGIRLTIILPDGTVVGDSTVGAAHVAGMENHSDRPEVRSALAGRTGASWRRSITLGADERYLAVPIDSQGAVVGVARAAVPATLMAAKLRRILAITFGTGTAAFVLMLAGTAIRARRIAGPLREMTGAARELSSGKFGKRAGVRTGDELEELAAALNGMASHLENTITQLDAERARLATILSSLSEGVIVVASDRTVRMMNREALSILGLSGVPVEGRPITDAIRHPAVLAMVDAWKRGEAVPAREVAIVAATGERTARLSATTVRYAGEGGADLLLTIRDVTEERRLARVKSDFVSNASHELRTPLTNIRGYLEAMEDALKEGAPIDPSFLSVAHGNALRMDRIIDDLLELSRAESGRSPLEIEEDSLRSFLERVAGQHRAAAEASGKALALECDEVPLQADLRKLAIAVSNLVDNAIKYGKEGGRITLSGRAVEGGCELAVCDDGPGIPPEHLPRIFERFYRVDKGRSREMGGTGLGLSIAKHIVEAHGGTIGAESRLGAGSRFVVRLPARPRGSGS